MRSSFGGFLSGIATSCRRIDRPASFRGALLRRLGVALCVAMALLGSAVSTVSATLIDRGLTTFDSSTGLSWLDLTETYGLSHDEVTVLRQSGNRLAGYRHATEPEVEQLFANAGIIGIANGSNGFNYEPVRNLVALLGTASGASTIAFGMTDYVARGTSPVASEMLALSFDDIEQTGTTGRATSTSTDFTRRIVGHYLIAATPVPSPASFGLAAIGLAVGASRRRRCRWG